jgi:prepilin-type N-terminal cleavage/methylation domain-containing protein/prepilin-type processing-associated H-X9-DG protein
MGNSGIWRSTGSTRRAKHAFTLVELLVVIAIIGILVALLLPALSRSKDKAKTVDCLGNLRQWALAVQLFANQNDDKLVAEGSFYPTSPSQSNSWYCLLPEVMGVGSYFAHPWRTNAEGTPARSIFICSRNQRRSDGTNLFHYCMNGLLDGTGASDRTVRMDLFKHPSRCVFLFDNRREPAVHTFPTSPGSYVHTNLHDDGANFAFLDGHSARFKKAEYWNSATGRANTNSALVVWMPLQ